MNGYTNRGTIMKLVLTDGDRVENHGTIMHIAADAVSDVTIISHGTIMNASGCRIINSNTYQKQTDQRVVIRKVPRQSDLQRIAELETANGKLRAQVETLKQLKQSDWEFNGNISKRQQKKIKEMKATIESLDHKIDYLRNEVRNRDGQIKALEKECERLRGRDYITHLENENENLHNQVGYYERETNDLRCQVADLHEQVSMTDRQQLLDEIDNLKDKLAKALSRENVQKQKAINAEREARIAKLLVWDDYEPTKEQVKAYYKQIRIMMDCETDY